MIFKLCQLEIKCPTQPMIKLCQSSRSYVIMYRCWPTMQLVLLDQSIYSTMQTIWIKHVIDFMKISILLHVIHANRSILVSPEYTKHSLGIQPIKDLIILKDKFTNSNQNVQKQLFSSSYKERLRYKNELIQLCVI